MASRELVHQYVDSISDDDLDAIMRYIERLKETANDPFQRALLKAATLTPEYLSPEDDDAITEAMDDNEELSHEEVRRILLADE